MAFHLPYESRSHRIELTDLFSFPAGGFLAYLCGNVVKTDVAWQESICDEEVKTGPSFWALSKMQNLLTGVLLPKERALKLINCTERLGLCTVSLRKNHLCYIFLHHLHSLAVDKVYVSKKQSKTKKKNRKIPKSFCFCHSCIAFKLVLLF